MASVLITGANSFIGNSFERYSANKNVRIVSLHDTAPSDIDFSGIDACLHLAALVHVFKGIKPEEYYRVNRDLTLEVAKAAKSSGVSHFIFMSSVKVYGKFGKEFPSWNEFSECHPEDYYGKSKYEAELALLGISDENFIVSIIRTPVVYGFGMKANMMKLVKLVKSSPVLPFAAVNNTRHYTYIENLIGLIDRIISLKKQGVFIAMDDDAVSTTALVKAIKDATGSRVMLFKLPGLMLRLLKWISPGIAARLFGSFNLDNTHTRNILSYKNPFSMKEGIQKTIDES